MDGTRHDGNKIVDGIHHHMPKRAEKHLRKVRYEQEQKDKTFLGITVKFLKKLFKKGGE